VVYEAVNAPILDEVPKSAHRVLDLGCGSGSLGKRLKESRNAFVTGVTWSKEEAKEAARHLDEVILADLETYDYSLLAGAYDSIICSHVLEHLRDPALILKSLGSLLAPGGSLIVALPNVVHWRQRLAFVRGEFRYSDGGLMDRTHLRFFDWKTTRELIATAGWSIVRAYGVGHAPGLWRLPMLGSWLDKVFCTLRPNLFGDQFVIVAKRPLVARGMG
jgi:2-polyprenyl-3-methyl-5-hydroxy-6-metoxy-1,4-benzoquinol methylase